jgi:hypothetical protein
MKIVKWGIDPGLDGDVYADRPYLYGPLASSINTLNIGGIDGKGDSVEIDKEAGIVVKEGGEGDGTELRSEKGVPESEAARKKWFLTESNRRTFTFEKGRSVGCDFFNAYLDFNGMFPFMAVVVAELSGCLEKQVLTCHLLQSLLSAYQDSPYI